jgi:hypothetical protein
MTLNPERIARRERLILAGLYLSKYDSVGLKHLGFGSFAEAYNVIGYALGSQPASIKNYRDEFDPLFPNRRKGWHKRSIRGYCERVFEAYKSLDIESFAGLIKSFAGYDENIWSAASPRTAPEESPSGFAKRLITGLAAEQYFRSVESELPEFAGYALEDATRLGCGYDFKLSGPDGDDFLAVEVKGLRELTGSLQFTPREHAVAESMRDRYHLFVVKNFRKAPIHEIIANPLSSRLRFTKSERITVQVLWLTNV